MTATMNARRLGGVIWQRQRVPVLGLFVFTCTRTRQSVYEDKENKNRETSEQRTRKRDTCRTSRQGCLLLSSFVFLDVFQPSRDGFRMSARHFPAQTFPVLATLRQLLTNLAVRLPRVWTFVCIARSDRSSFKLDCVFVFLCGKVVFFRCPPKVTMHGIFSFPLGRKEVGFCPS